MSKNGAQNDMKSFFLEVTFSYGFFFGEVCENSGKNSSHPQKFPCSYTVAVELIKVTSQDYVININDMWK